MQTVFFPNKQGLPVKTDENVQPLVVADRFLNTRMLFGTLETGEKLCQTSLCMSTVESREKDQCQYGCEVVQLIRVFSLSKKNVAIRVAMVDDFPSE
ncbi:MAG: hypothetical protein P8Y38_06405 [Deltaproteobacteria bacterium]|jgi:hypothetical protein